MWLIMTNENYDTPELRMMVFRIAKGRLLQAERRPFAGRFITGWQPKGYARRGDRRHCMV